MPPPSSPARHRSPARRAQRRPHPLARALILFFSIPLMVLHLLYALYLIGILLHSTIERLLRLPRRAAVHIYDSEEALEHIGHVARGKANGVELSKQPKLLCPLKVPPHMGLILVPPSERTRALAIRNLLGLPSPPGASASTSSPLNRASLIASHEQRICTLVSDVRRALRWASLVGIPELSIYDREGWLKDCARYGWLGLDGTQAGKRAAEVMRTGRGSQLRSTDERGLRLAFAVQPKHGTPTGQRSTKHYQLRVSVCIVGEVDGAPTGAGTESEQTLRKREARKHIEDLVHADAVQCSEGSAATQLHVRLNVLSASDGRPAMARLASEVVRASLRQLDEAQASDSLMQRAEEQMAHTAQPAAFPELEDEMQEYSVPSSYTALEQDCARSSNTTPWASRGARARSLRDDIVGSISVDGMERALRASPTISEPDVLLIHGSPPRQRHLHGFPPYALRLCEIVYDEGASRGIGSMLGRTEGRRSLEMKSGRGTAPGVNELHGMQVRELEEDNDPDANCAPSLQLRSFVRALECFSGSEQRHGK